MKFTRETPATLTIRSVDSATIRIGAANYENTIALTLDDVIEHWPDKDVTQLEEGDFSVLLDSEPEVIVLGTGHAQQFPPRQLIFAMARRGIGFESMDTRSAASTFNVLAGEGRRIAAVLYT